MIMTILKLYHKCICVAFVCVCACVYASPCIRCLVYVSTATEDKRIKQLGFGRLCTLLAHIAYNVMLLLYEETHVHPTSIRNNGYQNVQVESRRMSYLCKLNMKQYTYIVKIRPIRYSCATHDYYYHRINWHCHFGCGYGQS